MVQPVHNGVMNGGDKSESAAASRHAKPKDARRKAEAYDNGDGNVIEAVKPSLNSSPLKVDLTKSLNRGGSALATKGLTAKTLISHDLISDARLGEFGHKARLLPCRSISWNH